jgi:hypothetical protein
MGKQVRTIVNLIDDMDGTVLPEGEGQTVSFTWLGVEYEIDLSDLHAEQLATMMGPVIAAARRVGGKAKPSRAKSAVGIAAATQAAMLPGTNGNGNSNSVWVGDRQKRAFLREIKEWAAEQGIRQAIVGRLSNETREAWNAAHPERPAPAESPSKETRRVMAGKG